MPGSVPGDERANPADQAGMGQRADMLRGRRERDDPPRIAGSRGDSTRSIERKFKAIEAEPDAATMRLERRLLGAPQAQERVLAPAWWNRFERPGFRRRKEAARQFHRWPGLASDRFQVNPEGYPTADRQQQRAAAVRQVEFQFRGGHARLAVLAAFDANGCDGLAQIGREQ